MKSKTLWGTALLVLAATAARAQGPKSFDAAAAFGARQSVTGMRLSPDGSVVSYLTPRTGQGTVVYTLGLAKGAKPQPALLADGKPWRITGCGWVSNERLVCNIFGVVEDPILDYVRVWRVVAVNADGSNVQVLSTQQSPYSRGYQLTGGHIIDWLPDEDGAVLMTRLYLPDDRTGTRQGSAREGLGVDWIDTRTLHARPLILPRSEALDYITDGRGTVRVIALRVRSANQMDSGVIDFLYHPRGSSDWKSLCQYNETSHSGFDVAAVDADRDLAYGFKSQDGRLALYSMTLDDQRHEELILARPDVDVDDLVHIGRRQHVVGASYVTDKRHVVYFSPDVAKLIHALAGALPQQPLLEVADSSVDESKLLIFAGSDSDPGVYYIFNKKTSELATFLVAREELEGVKLASVRSVTYPSSDGVQVPGYLTLPPGRESAKGLPAIVLPHGGPSARDEWGFDWLSQFFAVQGYAVLQPNFRGSSGYGDAWFQHNGFKSWKVAIGDVLAGGRWLASEGIADPSKLAILGWSYGGYAALQSAVLDPGVFKAVIAIAPVTDLDALKEEHRNWSDFDEVSDFVGSGAHVHEGSPIEHAERFKVPVLLFHGVQDRNVFFDQSRRMADKLKAAGVRSEFVRFEGLDHYLDDSAARTELLRRSDAFLRQALGM